MTEGLRRSRAAGGGEGLGRQSAASEAKMVDVCSNWHGLNVAEVNVEGFRKTVLEKVPFRVIRLPEVGLGEKDPGLVK